MKTWPIVYIFCMDLVAELVAIVFKLDSLRIMTKPLLMILLFVIVAIQSFKRQLFKSLLLSALFCSLLGDTFLLFEKNYPWFFIAGLLSFLIAHLFYISLFLQIKKFQHNHSTLNKTAIVFLLIYVALLFTLLYPSIGTLKIPVLVYALIVATMFIVSLYAFSYSLFWQTICIWGALLFLLSDSILALNKFGYPFPSASFLVMLTYGLAQLFIVLGVSNSFGSFK